MTAQAGLVHPTALIDPRAELDSSVQVGPYAVIGAHVRIGGGTQVGAHCVIEGHTTIGADNRIFQFASIGARSQDMSDSGDADTALEIGDRNTIREFCTLNLGTTKEEGVTRIGSDNWIMAYVHIAHDCQIGSHVILANAATLGGHVHLGDWVFVGGLTGIHQFVRVGPHAMTGFQTRLSQDLPPFVTAAGSPAEAQSINAEGLKRRGFSPERIALVKQMYRLLYRKGLTLESARQQIEALRGEVPEADADIALMQGFLSTATRGIVR